MKYRKKPVVIEAVQWTGENDDEILKFCPDAILISTDISGSFLEKCGVENPVRVIEIRDYNCISFKYARKNDFIIKNKNGTFRPCNLVEFAETYDVVKEDSQ